MERRFWLGAGILAVFLALGLWTMHTMGRLHIPISQTLEQASEAALSGDLTFSITLAKNARSQWEQHRHITAVFADHTPMEEIDSLFAQLQVYAQAEDRTDFAAYCARLSRLTEAIRDAHRLNLQNIF